MMMSSMMVHSVLVVNDLIWYLSDSLVSSLFYSKYETSLPVPSGSNLA